MVGATRECLRKGISTVVLSYPPSCLAVLGEASSPFSGLGGDSLDDGLTLMSLVVLEFY